LNRGYLTYTLNPILAGAESAALRSLIRPDEQREIYIKFNGGALLRSDSDRRALLYASAVQNGWMTRNEIRQIEDLEPMEGGDVLTAQTNLVPVTQLGAASATANQATANAVRAWLGISEPEMKLIEREEGK
jgi:phage portal protein BeeE